MPQEPERKDVIAFVDGQNLFHTVKEAFGHTYPNFDVEILAQSICAENQWNLTQCRFYTGVPDARDDPFWHGFWTNKLLSMRRKGIHVFSRPLRYRNRGFKAADGTNHTVLVGEEKGIDVRIALDIIRLAHTQTYDVALIFSQDQDLSEAADEVKIISQEQKRWIKVASAFPVSPTFRNKRGINQTEWVKFDRATYDSCLDTTDYRPRSLTP